MLDEGNTRQNENNQRREPEQFANCSEAVIAQKRRMG
jgi:hypothetical protein